MWYQRSPKDDTRLWTQVTQCTCENRVFELDNGWNFEDSSKFTKEYYKYNLKDEILDLKRSNRAAIGSSKTNRKAVRDAFGHME